MKDTHEEEQAVKAHYQQQKGEPTQSLKGVGFY
jgi:hypothetical protein